MASECILDQGLSVNQHVVGPIDIVGIGTNVPAALDLLASVDNLLAALSVLDRRPTGTDPTPFDLASSQASRPSLAVPGGGARAFDIYPPTPIPDFFAGNFGWLAFFLR